MKMRGFVSFVAVFILFTALLCSAGEPLVFSKPEKQLGVATLMGTRILKKAYAELGVDFTFWHLPNKRCIVMANKGETDGEFERIAGLEKKYPNLVMVSVPIGYVDIMVYTKKIEFTVEGWHSLKPYSIGIERGFILAKENTRGMDVEEVGTIEQAFSMLDLGRNDIVVSSWSSLYDLKKLNLSGIRILMPPIDQLVLYHYLHKRHKLLAAELEAVLLRMEKEGELKEIQDQAKLDFQKLCAP